MWTFIKVWFIFCGGIASSLLLVKLFVWTMIRFGFSPIWIMVSSAIYIPLAAILLYVVFYKLLFKAADCDI